MGEREKSTQRMLVSVRLQDHDRRFTMPSTPPLAFLLLSLLALQGSI